MSERGCKHGHVGACTECHRLETLAHLHDSITELEAALAEQKEQAEEWKGIALERLRWRAEDQAALAERERRVAELEASKGDHCAACGANWLPDSSIDELSDMVEERCAKRLQTIQEQQKRIRELEEQAKHSASVNCTLVEQNAKLIQRNLALGDTPAPWSTQRLQDDERDQ